MLIKANTALEGAYGWLGRLLGRNALISLLVTAVVSIALCGAWLGTGLKTDLNITDQLIPYGDPFRKEDAFVDDEFSEGYSRTEYVSAFAKDGSNVATPQGMREFADQNMAIQSVSYTDEDETVWTKEALCARTTTPPTLLGFLYAAKLAPTGNVPAYGLPCSRYSAIDCFYDGKYDYYNGLMVDSSVAVYFPFKKTDGSTGNGYLPFSLLPIPNGFINSTSQPAKLQISQLRDERHTLNYLNAGCQMWAGVTLPADVILGGRQVDETTGQLNKVGSFLQVTSIMGVPTLARQLELKVCAGGCLYNMSNALGICLSDAFTAYFSVPPSPQLQAAIGACVAGSYTSYLRCTTPCNVRPGDASRAKAESIILGWEDAFIAKMKGYTTEAEADSTRMLKYHYLAGRSASDVASAAVGDLLLVIVGYVVALFYSILVLIRIHSRWSKVLVMCGGILCLLLSVGSAFAIIQFAGIALSVQIIQVLPFLTIGLGLIDIFVLTYTFRFDPEISAHHPECSQIRDQIGQMASDALRETGPSHAMITAASIVIFSVGASVRIPVIATFSLAALVTNIITYLMVTFGFLPILCLDAHRIAKQMSDCLPCISHDLRDDHAKKEREPRDRLKFAKRTAEILEMLPVKIGIIIGFAVLLIMACLNISTIGEIEIGLPVSQFLPKDSYVSEFYGDLEKYFPAYPHSFVIGLDKNQNYQKFDFPNRFYELMLLNKKLCDEVDGMDRTVNFTLGWINGYWLWANKNNNQTTGDCLASSYATCVNLIDKNKCHPTELGLPPSLSCEPNPAVFYQQFNPLTGQFMSGLYAYLAGAGFTSASSLNFSADGTIHSATQGWLANRLVKGKDFVHLIKQVRAITDATDIPIYPSGWAWTFYSQDLPFYDNANGALGFVALAVGLAVWLFILHPGAMALVVAHIVMMMAEVFGLMSQMQIEMNAVTLCNLIMGSAIGVSLTGYVARSFMRITSEEPPRASGQPKGDTNGQRQNRATNAYLAVTPPVLHGALGIFICVITLSVTKLPYFAVYFFNMYVLIVFLGIGNGLLLLPVVLSLIGPASYAATDSTKVYAANGTTTNVEMIRKDVPN